MVLAYNVCFWIVWFTIASLVYSLVSCCPVGPSVVANCGDGQLLRSLTSACGPGVHRSSHLHTVHAHKHTHNSLFWGGLITICLPDKCSRFLAWRILPHPAHPPVTFFYSSPLKRTFIRCSNNSSMIWKLISLSCLFSVGLSFLFWGQCLAMAVCWDSLDNYSYESFCSQ